MSRKTDKKLYRDQGIVNIFVQSGFGHNTQQPFVEVVIHAADWSTQMSPANARELAFNLLQCADAAESDGFLVGFLRQRIGVDNMRAVAGVLVEFRDYRAEYARGGGAAEEQRKGEDDGKANSAT